MTQEQKARAYDEALERARKLYNEAKANEYKSDMEDYESIFPELAESEDERIRRWLCDYFSSIDKAWIHKDITCIDILRWLEKQKEQKPAEWDDYTKTNLDRALQIIKNVKGRLPGYQTDDGIYECDKAIECLEHFLYRGLEIEKSAEWSEEDSNIAEELYGYFYYLKLTSDEEFSPLLSIDEILNWLKSLPGKFNLQPKQELSEEDERKLQKCIKIVERWEEDYDIAYAPYSDMLKSLKPSWKPSEEQMDALLNTLHPDDPYYPDLKSLYEQLKAL